jgi:Ca-activated chloride channel family protein
LPADYTIWNFFFESVVYPSHYELGIQQARRWQILSKDHMLSLLMTMKSWSRTMKTKIIFSFVLFLILLPIPIPALADGIIIPEPPICDPGPCPPRPRPISQLEIRYHHVDVSIEDQIAVTHVDQVFYNPNDWTIEGTYIFPIPHGAVVTSFILWIDGQAVEGQILSADEARSTYEEIVREMQDPALLEYAEQGAVQARIFPIPAGGERRIEFEYTEVLMAENGLVRYIYPLNTEKFSTQPLKEVRVSLDVKSSLPIRAAYSPSHPVAVSEEGWYHIKAGYEEADIKPDTDFAFYYSIGENEAFHLLSYRDPSDELDPDGFFTLLLAPSPDAAVETLPKDVMLVLDRSGSMEGEKFRQAQDALVYILQHLNPDDRFNIIAFSTALETYALSLRGAGEIEDAITWVERLSAVGSTDINRALLEAVTLGDSERPTYLIFLTDGLPTEGVVESTQILHNLTNKASEHLRLFAFGVGYDVDTYLLDSLAQNHHGTSSYVVPGEQIDEVLSTFYGKISTPVLTGLELDFGDLVVTDLYPSPLPDLFDGSQIVVVGRYRDGGFADVRLTGQVNNQVQTFTFPDQVFTADSRKASLESTNLQFIPRLWATRKIGYLLTQVRLHGPEQELIDQIVRLSIRYGIVTPYTSYLVTEPSPLGAAERDRIAEEQFVELESGVGAPTYGREAVEKAAAQGELEDSNIAAVPMVDAADIVRTVGSRTFVYSDEAWVDTAFDPDTMQTVKVAFLSDDYFALAASRSSLAAAFALGPRVIAISEGIAYEVVGSEVTTGSIDIPPTLEVDSSPTDIPPEKPSIEVPEFTLVPETSVVETDVTTITESGSPGSGGALPCFGGLLPFVLLPLALIAFRFRE